MPRSQWICRSCGSGFESRGKRDVHHRTQHQKLAQGGALGAEWAFGRVGPEFQLRPILVPIRLRNLGKFLT